MLDCSSYKGDVLFCVLHNVLLHFVELWDSGYPGTQHIHMSNSQYRTKETSGVSIKAGKQYCSQYKMEKDYFFMAPQASCHVASLFLGARDGSHVAICILIFQTSRPGRTFGLGSHCLHYHFRGRSVSSSCSHLLGHQKRCGVCFSGHCKSGHFLSPRVSVALTMARACHCKV